MNNDSNHGTLETDGSKEPSREQRSPIVLTIILPVHDEADSLQELHANLAAALRQLPDETEITPLLSGSRCSAGFSRG